MTPLMTSAEAARVLNVHVETLREWARRGVIGCVREGGLLRFTEAHLSDFIASKERPPVRVRSRRTPRPPTFEERLAAIAASPVQNR